MSDTIDNLILDLLEWLAHEERSYRDTMDAWRTSCPRLTVWEDANERGFVAITTMNGQTQVCPTPAGVAWLAAKRSSSERKQSAEVE